MIKKHPPKQAKPMDVSDHPENVMPPRMSQMNDITTPLDPGQSLQGPQAPSSNAFY